jgi:hypothetical protein
LLLSRSTSTFAHTHTHTHTHMHNETLTPRVYEKTLGLTCKENLVHHTHGEASASCTYAHTNEVKPKRRKHADCHPQIDTFPTLIRNFFFQIIIQVRLKKICLECAAQIEQKKVIALRGTKNTIACNAYVFFLPFGFV